jgi:hypothetical protein
MNFSYAKHLDVSKEFVLMISNYGLNLYYAKRFDANHAFVST